MAFDKDAFITALDGMSVMELNDLVKAIEEKFGVSVQLADAHALSQEHSPYSTIHALAEYALLRKQTD